MKQLNFCTLITEFVRFLYNTWAGYLFGGGLMFLWLYIDFNEVKLMVLGVISITYGIGAGIIQLWRMYIKGKKEQHELRELKKKSINAKQNNKKQPGAN
jgi:hypothetical protein